MIYDAKEYKFAKIVADDLSNVLQLMDSMESTLIKLEPYRRYKYVNQLINQFVDSRTVIESQLKKYQEIKSKKGAK